MKPAAAEQPSQSSGAGSATKTAQSETVSVGLFPAADDQHAVAAREIERGAKLAVEEYSAEAREPAVRLVVATSQGQWSAGAGELVRMVYSEGTPAVLGPVDGRAGHLAEQVVARAKGRFVLLAPWSSDATLTRIKVRWFFRLAPDDSRQAESLLSEIHESRGLRRIALVLAEADYDSRMAAEYFERAAAARRSPVLHKLLLGDGSANLDRLVEGVRGSRVEGVIFFAPPAVAARAARRLREAGVALPFFGPLALTSPAFLEAAGDAAEGTLLAAPVIPTDPAGERFRAQYRKAYGCEPSVPAAYGYDGMTVLLDALRSTGGSDPEALRAAVASVSRDGLTGRIQFDASGNRAGPAPLAHVVQGRLEPLRLNFQQSPMQKYQEGDVGETEYRNQY